MDEVFVRIRGVQHYLWRAVDQNGVVLDILVQARRRATSASRRTSVCPDPAGTGPPPGGRACRSHVGGGVSTFGVIGPEDAEPGLAFLMAYEYRSTAGTVLLVQTEGRWLLHFAGRRSGRWPSPDVAARAVARHQSGLAAWDRRPRIEAPEDLLDWRPLGESL